MRLSELAKQWEVDLLIHTDWLPPYLTRSDSLHLHATLSRPALSSVRHFAALAWTIHLAGSECIVKPLASAPSGVSQTIRNADVKPAGGPSSYSSANTVRPLC